MTTSGMNPLAEKVYSFVQDLDGFEGKIESWGLNNPVNVGNQLGWLLADAYQDLREKYAGDDYWSVLDFGRNVFSNLDPETCREVGEKFIADYKKWKNIP